VNSGLASERVHLDTRIVGESWDSRRERGGQRFELRIGFEGVAGFLRLRKLERARRT